MVPPPRNDVADLLDWLCKVSFQLANMEYRRVYIPYRMDES